MELATTVVFAAEIQLLMSRISYVLLQKMGCDDNCRAFQFLGENESGLQSRRNKIWWFEGC